MLAGGRVLLSSVHRLLLFAFCIFFLSSGQALALQFIDDFGEKTGLKELRKRASAGPVKIHPYVTQQVTYDSNVFLEPTDEKEDVVWTTTPGIVLDLPFDDHLLEVGYEVEFENFTKFTDQNDQNQSADALLDFHFPDWYANASSNITQTSSRAGTTFTDRVGRLEVSADATIGYKWKRLVFESDYDFFQRRYSSDTNARLDYRTHEVGGTLFYELSKQTQIFTQYTHGFIDYRKDNNRDGNFDRVLGGLKGQLLPRLTGIVKLGWENRRYKGASVAGFDSFYSEIALKEEFTDRTSIEFGYSRGPSEATFSDTSFYTEDRVFAKLEQKVLRAALIGSSIALARQEYKQAVLLSGDRAVRSDRLIEVGVYLQYNFREWWQFVVGYNMTSRNSKFNALDYMDHQAYFRTGIFL